MIIFIALVQIYIDWFAFKRKDLVYGSSKKSHYVPQDKGANMSLKDEQQNAGAELGNTTGFHEHAFDHPALWKKQPVVWIANDPLGVGRDQAERINAKHVEASTEYATLDDKLKLDVQRAPPDDAWYQGYTA